MMGRTENGSYRLVGAKGGLYGPRVLKKRDPRCKPAGRKRFEEEYRHEQQS